MKLQEHKMYYTSSSRMCTKLYSWEHTGSRSGVAASEQKLLRMIATSEEFPSTKLTMKMWESNLCFAWEDGSDLLRWDASEHQERVKRVWRWPWPGEARNCWLPHFIGEAQCEAGSLFFWKFKHGLARLCFKQAFWSAWLTTLDRWLLRHCCCKVVTFWVLII